MKLLQLNIWEGKLLKEVLAFIEKEKPDILCLQEVYSTKTDIPLPDMMFNSLESVNEALNYPEVFFSPVLSAQYLGEKAEFGLAIISRFPLQDKQSMFTAGEYMPDFTLETFTSNTRILQTCLVNLGDKSFSLANHHGHRELDPLGNNISVEKMELVKSKLEQLPRPIIFSGDFNVTGQSPAMRVFDGFIKSLTVENNIPSTLSQFGKVSNVACDHILISEEVKVTNFIVSEDLMSDHKALIMEFEL